MTGNVSTPTPEPHTVATKTPAPKPPVKTAHFELKNGKQTTLDAYAILENHALQMRHDGTDETYVDELVAKIKAGTKLPRIKVMRVDDGGIKGDFAFDGMHSLKANKKAGNKTVSVLLYHGTWADALQAAAQANIEHEQSGKRRTVADKKRALAMFLQGVEGLAQRNRPSGRTIAGLLHLSHTWVNEQIALMRPAADGTDTGGNVATPKAKEEGGELEEREGYNPLLLGLRGGNVATPKPAPGPGRHFDWAKFDGDIGSVKRGLEGMADIIGAKDSPEHVACRNALETILTHFKAWRTKHGK